MAVRAEVAPGAENTAVFGNTTQSSVSQYLEGSQAIVVSFASAGARAGVLLLQEAALLQLLTDACGMQRNNRRRSFDHRLAFCPSLLLE